MLAKRIIPTLLCRGRTLVKGQKFDSWRSVGVAEQAVRIHQAREVDELVLLDITATAEGRGPDLNLVEQLAEACFMPLTVGGGVRNVEDVRTLLKAGADKVVVGTAAYRDPYALFKMAEAVGTQAIVVAVDVKGKSVYVESGKTQTQSAPLRFARMASWCGAGEILLTSIDREGTMAGYDLKLVHEIATDLDIPVIANGGCGSYEHMHQALEAGASGVAAGAFFQFTDHTPKGAAEYLAARGLEMRV
jgi:cyclase